MTVRVCLFFFNDTATTEIYTLSLHDALPFFGVVELVEVDFALEGAVEAQLDDPLRCVEHDEKAVAPSVVSEAGGILVDPPDDHRPLGQGVLVKARRQLRLA